MKKHYTLLLGYLMASLVSIAQSFTAKPGVTTCPVSNGYYEYLPQGYNNNPSEKFPLIVFIPGIGELGNGTTNLSTVLRHGPANLINGGTWPTSFNVGGQDFKFIVITPQFTTNPWCGHINTMLDYIIANYKVDIDRIYLSGFSLGGGAVWAYVGDNATYSNRIAAIVPGAGAWSPNATFCQNMAATDLPVLALHNNYDNVVPVSNTNYFVDNTNTVNGTPIAAKIIYYGISGHDLTHGFSLNLNQYGYSGFADQNVYNWMLKHKRNNASPLPVNFTGFTASKQSSRTLLKWSTANEINNQGFEILRSQDAFNWQSLGFVNSSGTNSGNYSYVDVQPFTGKNYYKLKQVDFDGKATFTAIKMIDFGKHGYIIPLNPARNELTLNTDINFSNTKLKIYNLQGQFIKVSLLNGSGQVSADVHELPAGLYAGEIMEQDKKQVIRFIKQ
ncbi:MAG: T9SS type A sorting domain-containing protein [Ferruginibacter sp.]|nr:T9SS type A sorting domain-containing protein [Chitinophagaceae bacterium]MBP6047494.1 T9SS type A sorting domain-containing protein [Ferruginibacter sp.]